MTNIVPEGREMANSQKVHIYFYTRGDMTAIRKTVNYDGVLASADVKKGYVVVEKLAEYPDCEIAGIGKLIPRMMYMWWDEYKGELPPAGCGGKKEFRVDMRKHKEREKTLETYWNLHDRYNEWERQDQKMSEEDMVATMARMNRNVMMDALSEISIS